ASAPLPASSSIGKSGSLAPSVRAEHIATANSPNMLVSICSERARLQRRVRDRARARQEFLGHNCSGFRRNIGIFTRSATASPEGDELCCTPRRLTIAQPLE